MLELLGVSTAAELVYVALIADPAMSLAALVDRLGLKESEVRLALDELIDLALVTAGSAESGFRVVGPSASLAALLARVDADIARRQQEVGRARLAVAELVARYESLRWRDQSVRLDGVDAVRSRIDELAASATAECVSLNPTVSQTPDAKSTSAPLNDSMLERGVVMRSVYQDSFRRVPRLVSYARAFTAAGGHLRTAPVVPLILIIYDRSVAIVPIDSTDSRAGAYEIHSEGIVAVAYALFEQIWLGASDFGGPPINSPRARKDDPQIRLLLDVLASGGTDEVVARRLGVSVRTAKRLAKEVMDSLGAASRFEAGVKAARQGWI